jgi:hypothetical protein
MSILNTAKDKNNKKNNNLQNNKSAFIGNKVKANTKGAVKGAKHVGGAQRGS